MLSYHLLLINKYFGTALFKMKMTKKLFFTYTFLLCIDIFAQVGGNSTYTFLNLSNSARVAAMGGQSISINDDDLNFVYHNPALLNSKMSKHTVYNYVKYFSDINYGYCAYADTFKKIGTVAMGLHYINYGKFKKANEFGDITGNFKAYEIALNMFYAFPVFDSLLSAGVNFKTIYSQMETYNSYGLAFDLGLNYQSPDGLLSASFVMRNIGTQLKPYYKKHFEALPFDMQIAVSKKLSHAPIRLTLLLHNLHKWDLTYAKNSNLAYSSSASNAANNKEYSFNIADNIFRHSIVSAEFIPTRNFMLIFGYNHQRRREMTVATRPFLVGFSAGVYLKLYKIRFSYGIAVYHLAGASQHFSIVLNLADFYRKK